jgi:hypothetical protein
MQTIPKRGKTPNIGRFIGYQAKSWANVDYLTH